MSSPFLRQWRPTRRLGVKFVSGAVAAAVAAVLTVSAGAAPAHADSNVVPDTNFQRCINSHLGLGLATPITASELANFTGTFNCGADGSGITSLEGAQYMTNITEFDMVDQFTLSDVSPLKNLVKLTSLNLAGNNIFSLTPLSGLVNLTSLDLSQNHSLSDLTPLTSLTKLTSLNLFADRISNLTPLSGLTNLTWLYLEDNRITSVSALASLPNLCTVFPGALVTTVSCRVYLMGNHVSDLRPMSPILHGVHYGNGFGGNQTLPGLHVTAGVATALPQIHGVDGDLGTWTVTSGTATISNGLITLPTSGVVTLAGSDPAAVYSGTIWTMTVTTNVLASSVAISQASLTITVGDEIPLTATVSPATTSNPTLAWSTDDPPVARILSPNTLYGGEAGQTYVNVLVNDGSLTTASILVTVVTRPVTSMKLNKTSLAMTVGQTALLYTTVTPSNATNSNVSWSSSNTAVATVDFTGTVTAVQLGTATITATAADGSGVTASALVTVTPAKVLVSSITLSKTSLALTVGQTSTISATVLPSNATDKTLSWSSSNSAIAKVDSQGTVTAVGTGTVTVKATAADGSGVSASVSVTVTAANVLASSITMSPTKAYVGVKGSVALSATVVPAYATNKALTWTSSNANVATVDSSGVVTGKATGTVTITATAKDGSGKSATASVTVLATCSTFSDVASDNPFTPYICWMAVNKITTGMTATTYAPQGNVTREAMAAFMYRLAGSPTYTPPAKPTFSDVSNDKNSKDFSQFYLEIEWMNAQGITHGMTATTYAPKASVTREAMAAFLYRLAGSPTYSPPTKPSFPDVSNDINLTSYSPFYKEIEWMNAKGITTGMQDGTYAPKGDVTREAMAAFMWRMSNQKLYCSKYTKGIGCS